MDEKIKVSWEKVLHPDTLKSNIITASIFSMAFEMLKSSIIEKIKKFFTNGFDKNGMIVDSEYQNKVLTLDQSSLYASLKWLQNIKAINEGDLETFEHIKRCRNTLTHEMQKFVSEGVDFDVAEAYEKMTALLSKIELWWFENVEMAINPDICPGGIDTNQVIPGPIWSLQMLVDIALGPKEEAEKYYEYFVADTNKT